MGRSAFSAAALAALLSTALATPAIAADPKPCVLNKVGEFKITMRGTKGMVSSKINGVDTELMVDSGAFFSSLDSSGFERFGLKRVPMPPNFIIRGVGGEANMSLGRADTFEVGQFPLKNVEFLVGGRTMGVGGGILGQNILSGADVEYDFANGVIRFFKPQNCDKGNLAYWSEGKTFSVIPMTDPKDVGQHNIGTAKVNGRSIQVTFDTGASRSILERPAAERVGFSASAPGVVSAGISGGIDNHAIETWIAPFASFQIGGETITNTKLRVGTINLQNADMLLGADFFLSHRILVSRSQRQIYFTYNGGPVFMLDRADQPSGRPAIAAAAPPPSADAAPASAGGQMDADGYARRAAASVARRDFASAIDDLTKAIALKPDEAEYYFQRASAHQAARQPLMAIADYDETLKHKPDHVLAHVNRGEMFLNNRNIARAKSDFDAAVQAADAADTIGVRVGSDYLRAGLADEAIAQYTAWLTAHPKDERSATILANRCYARGLANKELEGAMADCNTAVRASANSSSLEFRGLIYLRMGQYDKAIADYDDSLKRQPRNAGPLYGRGLARIKKGQAAEGHADIQAAAAIDPTILARARQYNLVE